MVISQAFRVCSPVTSIRRLYSRTKNRRKPSSQSLQTSYTIRRFSIARNDKRLICLEFFGYAASHFHSSTSYRNPNNRGTLATPSETSCKEAPANPPELRNVSRRIGPTTRCSRSDPLYEYFQVRTRQERTAAHYPARLRPPRRNSRRTNHR